MKDNKYRTMPSWIDDFIDAFKKGTTKIAEPTSGTSNTPSNVSPSSAAPVSSPSVGPSVPNMSDTRQDMTSIPSPSHGDSGFENSNDDLKNTEININDLETITWNDETYKVLFDKENNSASIINGFGNIVTTLPNTSDINEVNKQLNAKQIVVSNLDSKFAEEMEDEVNKAFAYIEDEEGNVVSEVNLTDEEPDIKSMKEDEESMIVGSKKIASLVEKKINEYISNNLEKILENEVVKNYLDDKVASMVNSKIRENELRKIAEAEEEQKLLEEEEADDFEEADDLSNIEKDHEEEPEESEDAEEQNEEASEIKNDKDDKVETVEMNDETEDASQEETYDVHPEAVEIDSEDKFDYSNPSELVGKWAEIFKEATCPECTSDLEMVSQDDEKANIICRACSTKFYVDKNTGKIYKLS